MWDARMGRKHFPYGYSTLFFQLIQFADWDQWVQSVVSAGFSLCRQSVWWTHAGAGLTHWVSAQSPLSDICDAEEQRQRIIFEFSVNIFIPHRSGETCGHTYLQIKSLKSSDQSSGWWRVGGGFLLKEEIEKINRKIRRDICGGRQQRDPEEWWREISTLKQFVIDNIKEGFLCFFVLCGLIWGAISVIQPATRGKNWVGFIFQSYICVRVIYLFINVTASNEKR